VTPEIEAEKWSSRASQYAKRLVAALGRDGAHRAIDAMLGKMPNVDLAAMVTDPSMWMRSKQLPPPGDWVTWGKLEARGTGKTTAFAHFINDEVQAGRARSIGLAAQNETKTIEVQVGSLLKVAPPWFRPEWISSAMQLRWPNGAVAFARTPEVPGPIRSENHELTWLSEVQSWPASTMAEALANFDFATRVGYARTIWDANPKRGHAILKRWLAESGSDPTRYVVTRATIYENPYIAKSALKKLEMQYSGTLKGREELLGEMVDEVENALFQQSWIDRSRRHLPDHLVRRILSIDPAITDRRGSDSTGIVELGLGTDEQIYAISNRTGKYSAGVWPGLVIDTYVRNECDLIVVETNRGGTTFEELLRQAARGVGHELVVLGPVEVPGRRPGTVYVRPVHARGQKSERAEGASALVEKGRVSFVAGYLGDLEDRLCTFDGKAGKPDDAVDAFVHGCHELAIAHRVDPASLADFIAFRKRSPKTRF
jgi:phage terminase large subunit-like protein